VVSGTDAGIPVLVRHATGECPVHVEAGALARLPSILATYLRGRRLTAISDDTVAPLYGHAAGVPLLTFPAGEARKTRETWARLSDELLAAGVGRDGGIVAIGGGVVGDLAGFVAATYMRGLPFVQVPTTLLAMVDASVGGKTGVDTPHGKNLIGAFHQPEAVVADPTALATLPERELRSGLAEAVKHGLIADAAYLDGLRAGRSAILAREPAALEALVRRSVEIKAEVVGADEREGGRRATLNAGHTVAHALEHVSAYALAHGEAVALGLVAEAGLAEALGVAGVGVREAVAEALAGFGLPVRLPEALPMRADAVVAAMASDKKNRAAGEVAGADRAAGAVGSPEPAATIRFALPTAVGAMAEGGGRWTLPAPEPAIREALRLIGVTG
jgi:3-dehydroquinate synthase